MLNRQLVVSIVVLFFLILAVSVSKAQNPLPQGLDYPFFDSSSWKIANGYNDGYRHGGSSNIDDPHFYAYYAFDFVKKDGNTGGQSALAPADIYYYRVQTTSELCIDEPLCVR